MIKNITVTKDDFIKYSQFVINRFAGAKVSTPLDSVKNLVLWLIIGLILVSVFRGGSNSLFNFHWQTGLAVAIPFLLIIASMIYSSKSLQDKMLPNPNGLMLGEKELKFCEEGITDTTSLSISFYKWKTVEDVVNNDGNLYIFLDNILAEIIPSSSFSSEQEVVELMDIINSNRHSQ